MDYREIAKRLGSKKKVVLVHGNADLDAMGSAYAICKCFPNAVVFAPTGVDRVSKISISKIDFEFLTECNIGDYEQLIIVDTSSPDHIDIENFNVLEDTIVIDHHQPTGKWKCDCFIDENKVSCTQIILDILRQNSIPFTKDVGLMLAGGMLTDSGHFQYANSDMLKDFAFIMETSGLNMGEILDFVHNDVTTSERAAMLKCVGRSKFERVGDMLVASSYGSSFEASGCKALLLAGADVAFVASQRDENFRISARATQNIVRKGINLSEIVKDIGMETLTDGGGHNGAAGISGIGDIEAMLNICVSRTMDEFRKIKNNQEESDEID